MSELKPRITENGIDYILVGDYYIPDLKLPEEHRPIGKYGRMHREYLREVHPVRLNTLTLTGELWTYLADLNEQAQERLDTIMEQMKDAEGVTEELNARLAEVSSALVTAQQTAAAAQALHAGTMHQQLLSGKAGADQPERETEPVQKRSWFSRFFGD